MIYSITTHEDFPEMYHITLNGKPMRHVLAANPEEGWIEILDANSINALAPCITDEKEIDTTIPSIVNSSFAGKKKYGKVIVVQKKVS